MPVRIDPMLVGSSTFGELSVSVDCRKSLQWSDWQAKVIENDVAAVSIALDRALRFIAFVPARQGASFAPTSQKYWTEPLPRTWLPKLSHAGSAFRVDVRSVTVSPSGSVTIPNRSPVAPTFCCPPALARFSMSSELGPSSVPAILAVRLCEALAVPSLTDMVKLSLTLVAVASMAVSFGT